MIIYGHHAVKGAVFSTNKRQIVKVIYVEQSRDKIDWLIGFDSDKVKVINQAKMQQIAGSGSVHQGIAAEVELNIYGNIEDLICANEICAIAILDSVTDPHNLGAIVRSAACFGISGLVIAEHKSCKVTSSVIKAASGGLDYITIYRVKNLVQTIEKLKSFGFWIIALSESGSVFFHDIDIPKKIALVLGAEGLGVRPSCLKHSDFVAKFLTSESFSTLNVSNAAAIAFCEVFRRFRQLCV
jgi:23S rRNA (guanosine2251-2'-O)-methyltransferase